jgi:hypothetical protein
VTALDLDASDQIAVGYRAAEGALVGFVPASQALLMQPSKVVQQIFATNGSHDVYAQLLEPNFRVVD